MFAKLRPNHFINHGYSGQINNRITAYYPMNFQPIHRNQPYPYQTQVQNYNWHPYQQQNPYFQQSYSPLNAGTHGNIQQAVPYSSGHFPHKDAQFLFQNPLQPQEVQIPNQYSQQQMNGYPIMNPYPKQNGMLKQPGGLQTFINSFKSQDGTVDVNKMVNTAGQMVNAVSQVQSLVKGLGGVFKT